VLEKIKAMANAANERVSTAAETEKDIRDTLSRNWSRDARDKAPGSEILNLVMAKYSLTYNKAKDGSRLAKGMNAQDIDTDLKVLLKQIAEPDHFR
jgi:hypothetical protein